MATKGKARKEAAQVIALTLVSLLLIAATPSAKTPRPQPQQGAHTQAPTHQSSPTASPTPTASVQPTPTPTTERGATNVNNYYYYPEGSGDLAVWVQAGATVGLLFFAFWQMGFIRQGSNATQQAANAARDNAIAAKDAAEAAKTAQGGYVHFEKLEISSVTPSVAAAIRNVGQTPIFIFAESMRARIKENPVGEPEYAKPHIYGHGILVRPGDEWKLRSRTIEMPEAIAPGVTADYDNLPEGISFVVYGFVTYGDVFDRTFQAGFGAVRNAGSFARIPLPIFNYKRRVDEVPGAGKQDT